MADNSFFDEQTAQSAIKCQIVAKYFWVWAKVIIGAQKKNPTLRSGKIAYMDLFAGPGRYADGKMSTPIKILKAAINDDEIGSRLVTYFNDRDDKNAKDLENAINLLDGVEKLKYKPIVENNEIGSNIIKAFEEMSLIPTFFFVDPWGYKGLSLKLVNSVLKDWGCDCVFFFNYNRINMGLSNDKVKTHMEALFGKERTESLSHKLTNLNPQERELFVIEELCQALKEMGGNYVLPFRFKNENGKRTSHHLIFVSKCFKGYEIMKEIMAKESTEHIDGVPSFEYNPANFMPEQTLLFQLSQPIEELKENLLNSFRGQKVKMSVIYERHSIDKPFIKSNYKDALIQLENDGKIIGYKTVGKRRKNTFSDDVIADFTV